MNIPLKLTIVLLLFALSGIFAQDNPPTGPSDESSNLSIFQLALSGERSVAPDNFWKYKKGDNPAWAQPDFDDQNWPIVNLNQPANQNPELSGGAMGWLRLRFTVDSTLQKKLLALRVTQYGATEIFLDGRRIQQYGKISSDGQIQLYNPHNAPIPLRLGDQETHLLAIRFVFPSPGSNFIYNRVNISPVSVRFQLLGAALTDWEVFLKQNRTTIGFAFLTGAFCLLFLLLYVFYPQQKLNFFFGLFNFFYNLNFILLVYQTEGHYGLNEYVLITIFRDFVSRAVGVSILVFIIMALYDRIPRPFFWIILFIFLVDLPLNIILLPSSSMLMYANLVRVFLFLIFIWLAVDAFRRKKMEDGLVGLIAFITALIHFQFAYQFITGTDISYLRYLSGLIIIFPAIIIYLALRFAQANTSLELQLDQVQELSQKNLMQEQEKQKLLAQQKEMLEQQVQARTTELNQQKEELQHTLNHLKATQAQLVQQEKMASLGELTAGIAHEIQNPLNFINNFSEVSEELSEELQAELQAGHSDNAKFIADDIIQNLQKVRQHGERANAIVKSMLLHSRNSTGQKVPTDINALAEEYLNLSYQGLRATVKNFDAQLITDFDNSIGKINVVPQDLGRVLLNLYNNAFYATQQKKAQLNGQYLPEVQVRTRDYQGKIEIKVRDNGIGIPDAIRLKIFQPFFTTKPSGQGTGLGLSMSYDIITKGLGGELKVETQEGEYAEFTVQLPAN